jgi:hypothetical protein
MIVFTRHLRVVVLASGLFFSCASSVEEEQEAQLQGADTLQSAVFNVGGELFSIPSPILTALLVQESGVPYDRSVISPARAVDAHLTEQARALNLGVYGADLAYVSLFNQTQDAIAYVVAIQRLADKLGLTGAFNPATMNRIKKNIANKDSMTVLVSLAYRGCDAYLKSNLRSDISRLILIGGWVESLHFYLSAFQRQPADALRYRIAEQKKALSSIVKILSAETAPELKHLLLDLSALNAAYEPIEFDYTYIEPTHDSGKKITYINSTSEVHVSDEQLVMISARLKRIRDTLVNPSPF